MRLGFRGLGPRGSQQLSTAAIPVVDNNQARGVGGGGLSPIPPNI